MKQLLFFLVDEKALIFLVLEKALFRVDEKSWQSHRPRSPGNWIVSGPQGFLEDCRRHPSTSTGLLSPTLGRCKQSVQFLFTFH